MAPDGTVWETSCTENSGNPPSLTCNAAWTPVNPLVDSPPLRNQSAAKNPPAKKPAVKKQAAKKPVANHRTDKGNKHRG
ncbi:hypothetical protein ACU4GG_21615 [Streptomyces nojiriensis]